MTTFQDLTLATITNYLAAHSPSIQEPAERGHAAVAMVIKEGATSPELLFIIRAEHDRDPWSGNIGFPGGKLHDADESSQRAAIRETLEELSLDLQQARCLGRIDDLFGTTIPVLVSCFVYLLPKPVPLQPNHEVAATFWIPLSQLLENERHQQRNFFYNEKERNHPVVELLAPQQPLLWGITYRLVRNFFEICTIEFGSPEEEGL